jgi:hypothetical protein
MTHRTRRSRSLLFLLLTTTRVVFQMQWTLDGYIHWYARDRIRYLGPGGFQVKLGGLFDRLHNMDRKYIV